MSVSSVQHNLDLTTWFSDRELNYKPKHFIQTKTLASLESKKWILNKLQGRFTIIPAQYFHIQEDYDVSFIDKYGYPAFENPNEAILYELTWS